MQNQIIRLSLLGMFSLITTILFAQNVGIGILSPTARLFVNGDAASTSTVLYATNNYVGNSPVTAIEGYSVPNPGFGTGVFGAGGNTGVRGIAYADTYAGFAYGVVGEAIGTAGTHIGIYGAASGGANNFAGYFAGNGFFSGNLGIGTTIPGEKLTVSIPDNNSATNIAAFYSNDGTQGIGIGFDEIRKIGVNANSQLTINAKGNGNLILQNTATGNVGIGNPSPASLLSLLSNNTSQTAIDIFNTSAGGLPYRIQSAGSGTAGRTGNFEIRRTDVGKNMLTIQPTGNVGIGTNSPLARLNVNGDTTSTSVILYAKNNYIGNTSVSAIDGYSISNPGYGLGVFGTGGLIGVKGFANASTFAGTAYGVYGSTSGSAAGTRIGVFGSASGGITNWAGYFEGNSYFSENVGIGIAIPSVRLYVNGDASSNASVLYSKNNYTGSQNVNAIEGYSAASVGYGIGVAGTGGLAGVTGTASATTFAGTAYGLYGAATGSAGTRVGVYGYAEGGTVGNWAGYFAGNSYFSGNIGIGTLSPNSGLHIDNPFNIGPQITLSALSGGTPGISFRPYQSSAEWGNPAQAMISATDNFYSANINFLTKTPGNGTFPLVQRMTIQNDGNVGIGTTNPLTLLSLESNSAIQTGININNTSAGGVPYIIQTVGSGSAGRIGNLEIWRSDFGINMLTIQPGGNVGIGTTTPGQRLTVFNGSTTGTYTTTGWLHVSDGRLKANITPLESSLDKILKLQGVSYHWKGRPDDNNQIGFIAQEVEKIFPEVIVIDDEGTFSMATQNLTAPIVEAIKEQQAQMITMAETIENLVLTIGALQLQNAELTSRINQIDLNFTNSGSSVETKKLYQD